MDWNRGEYDYFISDGYGSVAGREKMGSTRDVKSVVICDFHGKEFYGKNKNGGNMYMWFDDMYLGNADVNPSIPKEHLDKIVEA